MDVVLLLSLNLRTLRGGCLLLDWRGVGAGVGKELSACVDW